jgi:hypothetical protein
MRLNAQGLCCIDKRVEVGTRHGTPDGIAEQPFLFPDNKWTN